LRRPFLPFLFLAATAALAGDPEKAYFASVEGAVNVDQPTGVQVRAREGDTLRQKSMVATSNRGSALLRTTDGSETRIHPATAFVFDGDYAGPSGDRQVRIGLRLGRLLAKVKGGHPEGSSYVISVGSILFSATDAEFSVRYDPRKERIVLEVLGGEVTAGKRRQGRVFAKGSRVSWVRGVQQKPKEAAGSPAP
jgi:hypothetical protein